MALAAAHDYPEAITSARENIAVAVRMLMAHRGVKTQEELAKKLGISAPQFTMRMKGRVPWRDQDFVELGRALSVPPSLFLLPHPDFLAALSTIGYRLNAAGEPMLFTVVPGPDEPVQTTLPFDRQLTTV